MHGNSHSKLRSKSKVGEGDCSGWAECVYSSILALGDKIFGKNKGGYILRNAREKKKEHVLRRIKEKMSLATTVFLPLSVKSCLRRKARWKREHSEEKASRKRGEAYDSRRIGKPSPFVLALPAKVFTNSNRSNCP